MGLFDRVLNLFKTEEDIRPAILPGRNEPCWCGSGRKYKKCHQSKDHEKAAKACAINCGPTWSSNWAEFSSKKIEHLQSIVRHQRMSYINGFTPAAGETADATVKNCSSS